MLRPYIVLRKGGRVIREDKEGPPHDIISLENIIQKVSEIVFHLGDFFVDNIRQSMRST